jgi:folate-dependent phosphoribosylglycinamide formyltransferase PurN
MRIISGEFCRRWMGRLLNVHPSLLPLHAGLMDLEVHQSVLDAGDRESGCTVHQVIEEVDGGEVVCQLRVAVVPGETANQLKAKVQLLEGEALIQACEMFYHDRTLPGDTDYIGKKALVDGEGSC